MASNILQNPISNTSNLVKLRIKTDGKIFTILLQPLILIDLSSQKEPAARLSCHIFSRLSIWEISISAKLGNITCNFHHTLLIVDTPTYKIKFYRRDTRKRTLDGMRSSELNQTKSNKLVT